MLSRGGPELSLKYSVADLLVRLRENREQHIANFEKAMVVYREKMIEVLKKKLSAAKKNEDVEHSINLPRPKNYADYYDEAIEMLDMCNDKEITLDRELFNQLVRDEWDWSRDYAGTSLSYLT